MKSTIHGNSFAHEGSTLAAHRAAMVAAVSGKRGKRYLKRQQLLELGEPAFLYLTEIVHRRPGQWFHDIDRLHNILQKPRSRGSSPRHGTGTRRASFWRHLH